MTKVIKVNPTWQSIAPIIRIVLQSKKADSEAIETAEKELYKMAKLADSWVAHVKEKESGK